MKCSNIEFQELSRDILETGSCLRFKAQGVSMYPFIRNGEFICIKKTDISKIGFGDIICYCDMEGRFVAHRVIGRGPDKQGKTFLVRGDFPKGSVKEEQVSSQQVLAKVIGIEKQGRYIPLDNPLVSGLMKVYVFFLPLSRYAYLFIFGLKRIFGGRRMGGRSFYGNENRLLRLLCRLELEEDQIKKIDRLLSADIQWEYLIEQAGKQGMRALLSGHLSGKDFKGKVPLHVLRRIKKDYYANCARNILIETQTKKIICGLRERKIKPIVYKGIYLSAAVYKNAALRPMSDIDILIRHKDLSGVNDLLCALGYVKPGIYNDFLNRRKDSSLNSLNYCYPKGFNFLAHVHTHVINSTLPLDFFTSRVDMERIWEKSVPIDLCGMDAATLCAEHQVIFLAQHMFTHHIDRLILACDLAEFIKQNRAEIDWRFLNEEARRFNLSYIVCYALAITQKLLGIKIPFKKVFYQEHKRLLGRALLYFADKGIYSKILTYCIYLYLTRGLAGRIRFLLRTIFPERFTIAHNFNIPVCQVRFSHYSRRIMNNVFKGISS